VRFGDRVVAHSRSRCTPASTSSVASRWRG